MKMSSRCPYFQKGGTESDKRMGTGRLSYPDHLVSTLRNRLQHERIVRKSRLMRRVVPQELVPDMILTKPVTNANGLPIVAAGTLLDAAMIERLRQMDLPSVYVDGEALDSGGKPWRNWKRNSIIGSDMSRTIPSSSSSFRLSSHTYGSPTLWDP